MKARSLHGEHILFVVHERLPDQTGAKILRHQDRNPLIDAQNIGVIPVGGRMEGVHEPVAAPGLFAPFGAHRAEHRDTCSHLTILVRAG